MNRMRNIALACSVIALPTHLLASVTAQTVSFQPGVDGYAGLVERLVSTQTSSELPSATNPNPANWFIDGGTPDQQAFQRWENIIGSSANQIPRGATVLSARLTVTTGSALDNGNAQSGGYFGVAGLTGRMVDYTQPGFPIVTRHFDQSTTYVNYNAGGPNFENGKGTFVDRAIGSFVDPLSDALDGDSVIDQDQAVSANVTSLVQRWVNDPTSNYGLAVQTGVPASTTDGWMFGTQWNADATRRPKLEVTYTTDAIETHTFQQGVNGYAGGISAWVRADNNVASPFDGSAINQAFLDGPAANSPDDQGLFRFNNLFSDEGGSIDRDAEIVDAYFVLTTGDTSTNSRSSGGFEVAGVTRDWDLDITNSDKPSLYSEWSNGFGPSADDPDGNGNADLTEIQARVFGMTHGQVMPIDITALFRKWQTGELENYGLNVQSYNTADGWQVAFTGASDPSARPQLMVRTLLPTGNWIADADGTWTSSPNWESERVPSGKGHVAIFGPAITAARTVTMDTDRTVGEIRFDSGVGYTIAGTGVLTLDRSSFSDVALNVLRGDHVISAPVVFAHSTRIDVAIGSSVSLTGALSASDIPVTKVGEGRVNLPGLRAASLNVVGGKVVMSPANTDSAASVLTDLTIATGATLDLTDNALILDYLTGEESPLAAIADAILDGRLTSSAAGTTYAIGTLEGTAVVGGVFAGVTLDADTVVADLTLKGDANLDYRVNFDDLLALAQNYGADGGKQWSEGDANYDGVVNFDDLLSLAQNYGGSAMESIALLDAAGAARTFVSDWALARSLTPEPTTLAVFGLGASVLVRRRRA